MQHDGIPDWCEQAAWTLAKRCEENRAEIENLSILPDAAIRCWGPRIIYEAWLAGREEREKMIDLPPTDQYARDCSGWRKKPG